MKLTRLFAAAVAIAGLAACQTYEVDPVKPAAAKVQDKPTIVAQALSPNVVLVIDRSGSMADNPDGSSDSACSGVSGQNNLSCKWDGLLSAMTGNNGFIANLVQKAAASDPVHLGMVTFGGYDSSQAASVQNSCSAGKLQYPVNAADNNTVQNFSNTLLGIVPAGATPTASSLAVAQQALQAAQQNDANAKVTRQNYIVLLTDGAPNCNGGFAADTNNCDPSGPRCVSQGACFGQQFAPYGCLDEDNTVATVQGLSQQSGINTFVIGFGADFANQSSPTNETLERMAIAGNTRRVDSTGQNVEPAFYNAASSSDLQDALNAIIAAISNKCVYQLDSTPASAAAVEVIITQGGTSNTLSTSQYTVQGAQVTVTDATVCQQLSSATQANPVTIEFKFLSQ